MKRFFIAGEWIAGKAALENITPSDIREVISRHALADAVHADAAISPAVASQQLRRIGALDAVSRKILARRDAPDKPLAHEGGKTQISPFGENARMVFAGRSLPVVGGQPDIDPHPALLVDTHNRLGMTAGRASKATG